MPTTRAMRSTHGTRRMRNMGTRCGIVDVPLKLSHLHGKMGRPSEAEQAGSLNLMIGVSDFLSTHVSDMHE